MVKQLAVRLMTDSTVGGDSERVADDVARPRLGVTFDEYHPLIADIAEQCDYLLNSVTGSGWAWSRMPVALSFHAVDDLCAAELVDSRLGPDGKLHTRLLLHFNLPLAVQEPQAFIEHVVPRAVALALGRIERVAKGVTSGDTNWPGWFSKLTGREPLTPAALEGRFVALSQRLVSGAVLVNCECAGTERYRTVPADELLQVAHGEMVCAKCRHQYVRTPDGKRPAWLSDEVAFTLQVMRDLRASAHKR